MKNSIQFKEDLNSNTDNIILGILQLDMCVSLHAACTQHLARGMPVDMHIREVCCANASQNL